MKRFLVVVIVGLIILLCIAAIKMDTTSVRIWAVMATILILPSFIGGVIVGNLESRGKIDGIDLAVDKIAPIYDHATKTVADLERKRPPPTAPTVQVYNAATDGLPPISHRRLTDGDEVIDL